jgi:predicted dehydrogenase
MVEKPLAGSVEEAEAMVQASEWSDRFVAVGYQDMYGPWAPAMKEAVLSGVIGEVRSVRVFGIWGRSEEYYQRNSWAGKLIVDGRPIYDSPFNNAFAHYLNLALYLAGPDLQSAATPVAVDGSLWRAHDIESCDTACLNWKTACGPEISVFFSHASSENLHPELVVQGTKGSLHWKFQSQWDIRAEGAEPVQYEVPAPLDVRMAMIRQLVEKVQHPETSVYTPRQALAQVQASALAQQLPIQVVDRSLVHCSTTTDESGQIQRWRVIEDLEDIGRRFLQGEPVRLSAAVTCEEVSA